jgi:predicted RNase H-like nuclease (RuvC/YqgF family)
VLEKAAEAARGRFKAMTGVEAKGYPIVVPADLLVRDSEQQTAVLNRAVLFDVPIAAVVAVNDAQVAEEKQRNEQRQESIRQQQAASSRPADADVESLQRRISDLERRNAELEGQVKLMKEMLSQQQAQ